MKKIAMAWEWNWPKVCFDWGSFMLLYIDLRLVHKGDHSPGIHLELMLLGIKLFDCGYYNIYHADEPSA